MRDITLEDTFRHFFTTRQFSDGVPTVLANTPVLSVLEENNATPITAGVSLSVSRASVVGLNKTLANELGGYNITVNNVMPGFTKTSRLEKLLDTTPTFARVTEDIPLGRFGEPAEFAAAVAFLASERASYITGVSLAVDGGWIKGIM